MVLGVSSAWHDLHDRQLLPPASSASHGRSGRSASGVRPPVTLLDVRGEVTGDREEQRFRSGRPAVGTRPPPPQGRSAEGAGVHADCGCGVGNCRRTRQGVIHQRGTSGDGADTTPSLELGLPSAIVPSCRTKDTGQGHARQSSHRGRRLSRGAVKQYRLTHNDIVVARGRSSHTYTPPPREET